MSRRSARWSAPFMLPSSSATPPRISAMSEYCPHAVSRLSRNCAAKCLRYAAARSSPLTAVTNASGVRHFSTNLSGISPSWRVPRFVMAAVASFRAESVSMYSLFQQRFFSLHMTHTQSAARSNTFAGSASLWFCSTLRRTISNSPAYAEPSCATRRET